MDSVICRPNFYNVSIQLQYKRILVVSFTLYKSPKEQNN